MLWRQRSRNGRAEDRSDQQVTALRHALAKREEAAARERRMYRQLISAVGALMFASGLAVGLYHAQIKETLIGLWESNAEAGYAAYRKGKYKTALEFLRPIAEGGDARAQRTLGLIYYGGGHGVQRDDAKAVKWLHLAAEQGEAAAEFNLGVIYAEGRGVPQDNAEAEKWYRLAAEQGNAPAEYNLGLWYAKGLGGSPDYVHAHMWFNLAASHFPESDAGDRSLAVNNRNAVASKMTSGQVTEAQWLALEWKPK
jgi:TPR repeat protein